VQRCILNRIGAFLSLCVHIGCRLMTDYLHPSDVFYQVFVSGNSSGSRVVFLSVYSNRLLSRSQSLYVRMGGSIDKCQGRQPVFCGHL